RMGAAVQAWVGWMDAGTVDGTLSRFVRGKGPQTVVIGPWSHGTATDGHDADPFHTAGVAVRNPTQAEAFERILAFFDGYLKGDGRTSPKRIIRYSTLGEGTWHTTTTWPPAGVRTQRWYLGAGSTLDTARPATGSDRYVVDFTASTGPLNRWHTQAGSD